MRLLCLSNGHGEDIIAVRILQALQQHPGSPELEALPIVGQGHAYSQLGIPLIGTVKTMPSGGFIYMDGRQLARDIQGGLLQLTLAQIGAVKAWVRRKDEGIGDRGQGIGDRGQGIGHSSSLIPHPSSFILAVGDIVPLLFAWLSGAPYAFVGTAKSEYYLRDEAGWLPRSSWFDDRLQRWTGCIYLPWERWLLSHPRCKAVFPRDGITATTLQQHSIPAFDLGNPMMDGLGWKDEGGRMKDENGNFPSLIPHPSSLIPITIALLPGSRPPEAYSNWEVMLQAANGLIAQMRTPLRFLAAIAPGLDLNALQQALIRYRWQQTAPDCYSVGLGEQQATIVLTQNRFAECLNRADLAIAMAGTATEQFVGLGKPAITIPGNGPQFTAAFAESQTRLLGPSVTLVQEPSQVPNALRSLLQNPDRLHLIAENGRRRMGEPGAAQRIAACLVEVGERMRDEG